MSTATSGMKLEGEKSNCEADFKGDLHECKDMEPGFTGGLEIKIDFNGDLRECVIHNSKLTYEELTLMIQWIYGGKIKADDEIRVKFEYKDGEMASMANSSDVEMAIDYSRFLKLQIFVVAKDAETKNEKNEDYQLRSELVKIRAAGERLFDSLVVSVQSSESDAVNIEFKDEVTAATQFNSLDEPKKMNMFITSGRKIRSEPGKRMPVASNACCSADECAKLLKEADISGNEN